MFEKEVEQIYGKRLNIETQINALESAASSADVLKAMLVGKDALVQVMKETYGVSFIRVILVNNYLLLLDFLVQLCNPALCAFCNRCFYVTFVNMVTQTRNEYGCIYYCTTYKLFTEMLRGLMI